MFGVPLRDSVGMCSAGHTSYADVVIGSARHDANDPGSDTYNSTRSQSMGTELYVALAV